MGENNFSPKKDLLEKLETTNRLSDSLLTSLKSQDKAIQTATKNLLNVNSSMQEVSRKASQQIAKFIKRHTLAKEIIDKFAKDGFLTVHNFEGTFKGETFNCPSYNFVEMKANFLLEEFLDATDFSELVRLYIVNHKDSDTFRSASWGEAKNILKIVEEYIGYKFIVKSLYTEVTKTDRILDHLSVKVSFEYDFK